MEIKVKSIQKTVRLDTLKYGDTFFMPSCPEDFYIVIEPDYELDYDAGVYCVNLRNGELYRFDDCEDVVPVKFEATVSF
jgi:hypothetical protein